MPKNLELTVGNTPLSVRRFSVREELSEHFRVTVWVRVAAADMDLESFVGGPATFSINMDRHQRTWHGAVAKFSLVRPETKGESTYLVEIVPPLWFTTQVRQRRIFQHLPTPDIVESVLEPYGIRPRRELGDEYADHEYIVQCGETDYDFVNRLLEDAGIAYRYDFAGATELVLTDAPEQAPTKASVPYADEPNPEAMEDYVTKVRLAHRVRPGKVTIRDFDFRKKPDYPLRESHEAADFQELEHYYYEPGAMLMEKGGRGPMVADDEGTARHLQSVGRAKAARRLLALRRGRRSVAFTSNVASLSPGTVFTIEDHPHSEIADGTKLVVSAFTLDGSPTTDWVFAGESTFVDDGYEPALKAPRPRLAGVTSAVVTGPKGEEIHTDEFGRVRAQFHWDREGKGISEGKAATKWMRVSQPWAGRRYGAMLLPRVGHEVLVRHFEGSVEQPAVVGRVHNKLQPVPYPLPKHEIKSVWKTDSSPHEDGCYNEIRLDDRKDLELFYTQAERDRQELARRHEMERTGINRVNVVGNNRSTVVGETHATMVGESYSIQIVEPPSSDDLHLLDQRMPKLSPKATKLAMADEKILATTGDATLELDGDEAVFEAKGQISIKGGTVIIEGGPNVKINCGSSSSSSIAAEGAAPAPLGGDDPGWFTWLLKKLGFGDDDEIDPAVASMLGDFPEESQKIASQSPTLVSQLEQLEQDGWTIETGPAGGGSYAVKSEKRIVIADGKSPTGVVSTTAHEVGHAVYPGEHYHPPAGLTRQEYIDRNVHENLKDEGYAQFNTNVVREEIMGDGGPDIGLPGGGDYTTPYEQYKAGNLTQDQAVEAMANVMGNETTSTTGENYKVYYGKAYADHWDSTQSP